METVDRGKKGIFKVYSKEEADALQLRYVPWKEVVGHTHALTDDGFVVDVLKVQKYTDFHRKHSRTLITLSVGKNFSSRSAKIEYLKNKQFNSWSEIKPQSWQTKEATKARTKNAVKVYVKQMLSGHVDWDVVGTTYRPDQQVRAATVKRLFREKEIKGMIDAELEQECIKRGITKGYVLDLIKKAAEIAESREDPGNMLKAADQLSEHLGLHDKNKAPQIMEFGITREIGDTLAKIDKELEHKTPVQADIEAIDE